MENATDALYMAFAVLAFVIALSVSIFAFSEVASASQSIINSRDRETLYEYVERTGSERIVTREDIVPTLYRICNENYIVKFENLEMSGYLYEINISTDTNVYEWFGTNSLDFSSFPVDDKTEILDAILSGDIVKINDPLNDRFKWIRNLQSNRLYDIIGENTFEERAGIYNTNENKDDEANKTEKRILTYICQ